MYCSIGQIMDSNVCTFVYNIKCMMDQKEWLLKNKMQQISLAMLVLKTDTKDGFKVAIRLLLWVIQKELGLKLSSLL